MIEVVTIPVKDILLDPRFQPRSCGDRPYHETEVQKMRAAGVEAGHPNGWSPEKYDLARLWRDDETGLLYVVEGFHRVALARECGLVDLPVFLITECDADEAVKIAEESNLKTNPLDPVGEARVYRKARESGASWESIARRFDRRPTSYYQQRASLAYLSPGAQDDVRRGLIPVGYAEAIGNVVRDGASPGLEKTLVEMAVTTKTRIEAFRRLADSLLRKQKGFKATEEDGLLFDAAEITDLGASAARDALVETTLLTGLKDGWAAITSAAETQIRRLRKAKLAVPPQLGTLISEIDRFRATTEHELAQLLGEETESGAVSVGTGVVHCRPFLRWVGGKDLLAGVLAGLVRERLGAGKTYIEPFLGSGAVFLALAPERAILADSIEPLVETWKAIQKVPEKVSGALDRLVLQGATEERFKTVRESAPRKTYDVAARFIYLNWTAFNGLYRVNREGKFNVAFGRVSSPKFPTLGELTAASKALEGADLVRWDYRQTLKTAVPGDCVYIDPPKAAEDGPLDLSTLVGEVLRLTGEGVGVVVSATVDSPLREMLLPRGFDEVLLADTRGKGAPRQVALVSRRSNNETR